MSFMFSIPDCEKRHILLYPTLKIILKVQKKNKIRRQ